MSFNEDVFIPELFDRRRREHAAFAAIQQRHRRPQATHRRWSRWLRRRWRRRRRRRQKLPRCSVETETDAKRRRNVVGDCLNFF